MIINEKLIDLDLKTESRMDTINYLSELALNDDRLEDKKTYLEKVIARENEISTDLGHGIAIPHGKSDSVKEPFIIFAKLHQPIVWNEKENSKVDLVFMLGVPNHSNSNIHLKLISKIARKLMDEDFLNMLRNSKNKNVILNSFNTIKL